MSATPPRRQKKNNFFFGPLAGTTVGEYRLVARLATGGMSEVWLSHALAGPERGKPVIVKRLLPRLGGFPDCVLRFRAEAELGTRLIHLNLARCFGLLQQGPELFLAQELVGGETVSLLVRALSKDPAHRFQSAAEFSTELQAVAARAGFTSGPKSLAAAVAQWAPKSPRADWTAT